MVKTHCDICDAVIPDEPYLEVKVFKSRGTSSTSVDDSLAVCQRCIDGHERLGEAIVKRWDALTDADGFFGTAASQNAGQEDG